VSLAARGARNLDAGDERIDDEAERAALARQARRVHVQAVTAGVALTILSFFAPE
jgi:hypothetical protein